MALKGPLETRVGEGYRSINVYLRKTFNLYANLRPVHSFQGVHTPFRNVDLVVVRENTEDLYAGIEHQVAPGVVESIKVITARASKRIARFAFEYARREGRNFVTAIHKANIMKLSDGLFLKCARGVSADFPEIRYEEQIVDAACMRLVTDPQAFDVLLLENLYGDIVSDLCAGLVGGLGVVPGANYGDKGAIFEAVHGTAPDIAGKGLANPIAAILSGAMLLDYLGHPREAQRIRAATGEVLRSGAYLDQGPGRHRHYPADDRRGHRVASFHGLFRGGSCLAINSTYGQDSETRRRQQSGPARAIPYHQVSGADLRAGAAVQSSVLGFSDAGRGGATAALFLPGVSRLAPQQNGRRFPLCHHLVASG